MFPDANKNAKSLIDAAFSQEAARLEETQQRKSKPQIDLKLGAAHNFPLLTQYQVAERYQMRYIKRLTHLSQGVSTLQPEHIAPILNAFCNTEKLLHQMIARYYDKKQLQLFSGQFLLITDELSEISSMYQEQVVNIFDRKADKWDIFDEMAFLPGWQQQHAALRLRSSEPHVPIEQAILAYAVSDYLQTVFNCLTEALRTEIRLLAQFTQELSLLSDILTDVFTRLYQQQEPSI